MSSTAQLRRFYAEFIVRSSGAGADPRLIEAFAAVPREHYVGPGPWQVFVGSGYLPTVSSDPALLYQDLLVALAPERHINNGQPSLHARCLAAAALVGGESVLHIGAGTGYYTAILATLAGPGGHVLALEIAPDLAARAAANLAHFPNVELRASADSAIELPPSDLIYVSAGATHPLAAWLAALKPGGRLIFPLTPDEGFGVMLKITRLSEDRCYAASAFMRVAFIPCIGARDAATSAALTAALAQRSPNEVRSLRIGDMPDATAWCVGSGWWLSSTEPIAPS